MIQSRNNINKDISVGKLANISSVYFLNTTSILGILFKNLGNMAKINAG